MLIFETILVSWSWVWVAVCGLLLAAALIVSSYRGAPPGIARWLCPVLKLLGFTALALCLLEPLWTGQRARPGANLFAILADNSESLRVKDRGASRTRGEALRVLLNPQKASWQESLEENFAVRRYFFDARLQNAKDFGELTFEGRVSALGSALKTLARAQHGQPIAGILLFSDGNATDLRAASELPGLPPIYPVVLGNPQAVKDIAIQQVRITQTDFEDAPVSVQADVTVLGFHGQRIVGRLLDGGGREVMIQKLEAPRDGETLAFRFEFRPEQGGVSFYRVVVRAASELETGAAGAATSEATLANNSRVIAVDRGSGPHRILYVAGRPNWEFKFLNRAAQDDNQLALVALIRVARREPKFNFLGRAGESSNPLFRGFGQQSPEQVESYDQPVLVRLNTRDAFELRGGFPRTPEELYGYEAVILDDLEEDFFTPDQAALLQRFVSERGGGFLMLGGTECFQQGNYQRTPIGDMLPVYLDHVEETNAPGPLRLNLTREGLLQPWARLRDNEAAEEARLQDMAPFRVLNKMREVKPGASVIATVRDDAGKTYPALVVQRFGRGRTAALPIGDVWHWGLHDAAAHRDMDKFWRQLLRWLATDVPKRVELTAEPQAEDPNGAVRLRVIARDARFQPLDNASVSLRVQPVLTEATGVATNALIIPVDPSSEKPGVYEASYFPRLTGGYRAMVCVTNAAGEEVGRAAAGWSADLAAEEFRSLSPNVALLEAIARKTGGEVVSPEHLDQFVRNLPNRRAPVMEAWSFPLWDTPAMFAFALACFVSEWGLRRRKGLP